MRLLAVLAAAACLGLAACDRGPGDRGNHPPEVRLLFQPAAGQRVPYALTISWTGHDADGVVDHYEYAVDLPDSLSLPAINDPRTRRIEWRYTRATSAHLIFSTPFPDSSALPDSVVTIQLTYPGWYHGHHNFFVRAVDNEGAVSPVDHVGFTAASVAPRTSLDLRCFPDHAPGVVSVGRAFAARWSGIDPDHPESGHPPRWYEYKLMPVVDLRLIEDLNQLVHRDFGGWPWTRVGPEVTAALLLLDPPQDYVFVARGVDEAGAVEDDFYFGENAVGVMALDPSPRTPVLTVRERLLGTFTFPRPEGAPEVEVPVEVSLALHWSAGADRYCAEVREFDWALDPPDADAWEPAGDPPGWDPFGPYGPPLYFTAPGRHLLLIGCRDTEGNVTVGRIALNVVAVPLDRAVLYVDDFNLSRGQGVTDEMMDHRARAMLVAAGCPEGEIFQLDTFGPAVQQGLPALLKLSDLARYRLVIWSVGGSGYQGRTALAEAAAGAVLSSYLSAGGAVWIFGQQVFGALKGTSLSMSYEDSGLYFRPGEFVADYLHITGGDIRDVQATRTNGMVRSSPARMALAESFPAMEIDSTAHDAAGRGGLPFVDAMFQPTHAAGLDTLYTMETPSPSSPFRDKPIAFRYLDPDPASKRGPLAVFGFPFHLLKQGSAAERTGVQGMARAMVDWFKRHGG